MRVLLAFILAHIVCALLLLAVVLPSATTLHTEPEIPAPVQAIAASTSRPPAHHRVRHQPRHHVHHQHHVQPLDDKPLTNRPLSNWPVFGDGL